MKKKALFVSYDGLPYNKLRCHTFSDGLNKIGLNTTVFSFRDNLDAPYHGPESYKTSSFTRLILLLKAIWILLRTDRKTIFIIEKAGFHSLAPTFVSFIKGNKIILDYDDYEYYEDNKFKNIIFKIVVKRADAVIAASHFLKDFIEKKTSSSVFLIPGGTDTAVFKPRSQIRKESKFTYVWVGNISDDSVLENIIFLIDCFKIVNKRNSNTQLYIRASGDRARHIEEYIEKNKIRDIKLIGWIDQLPSFLNTVHCGVYPLVKKNKYNASKCPGKLFEYMSMKLPVVATDFGENNYILTDAVEGYLAKNKKQFSEKMLALSKLPALCKLMGDAGRKKIIKNYNNSSLMLRLKNIIENVR